MNFCINSFMRVRRALFRGGPLRCGNTIAVSTTLLWMICRDGGEEVYNREKGRERERGRERDTGCAEHLESSEVALEAVAQQDRIRGHQSQQLLLYLCQTGVHRDKVLRTQTTEPMRSIHSHVQ